MKLRNHSLLFFAMLMLATAAFLAGCATSGIDRSVKTSQSIETVGNDIKKISLQSDATAASLDSLVKAGQPDLKKAFDAYSNNLAKLESQGKQVLTHIDEMNARSKEYFSEWEKEGDTFKNQQIRELSEERRNNLAELYARVHTEGRGIKSAFLTYITDLKEIQKYLSTDLTPKGVESITPVVNKTVTDRDFLKSAIIPVLSALDDIKAELYLKKK